MSKLFKVAGIVTDGKGRSKVRFGNDLAGRIKILAKAAQASRLDFVELPTPMNKVDSLKYLATLELFKSSSDQATIADALSSREDKPTKPAKEPKTAKVKSTTALSIDSIKARTRKPDVTPTDVLNAVNLG